MMLKQVIIAINTLKYPKSLDCMYGTRYTRLSNKTKKYHFLNLLLTVAQTHDLNTYNYSKHQGQDIHEVSQGLEHVTFGELDTYVYVS